MTTTPWPVQFELVVDHVHDGDTIYGTIYADAGLDVWIAFGRGAIGATPQQWGVRLYGINAPELTSSDPVVRANAVACRDYLMLHVTPRDVLKVDSYSFDKYDKRMDGVPFSIDGTNLCQLMLSYGHGVVVL